VLQDRADGTERKGQTHSYGDRMVAREPEDGELQRYHPMASSEHLWPLAAPKPHHTLDLTQASREKERQKDTGATTPNSPRLQRTKPTETKPRDPARSQGPTEILFCITMQPRLAWDSLSTWDYRQHHHVQEEKLFKNTVI
jgi:hypothetical protein